MLLLLTRGAALLGELLSWFICVVGQELAQSLLSN